jgi:arylsulfatase A-like enzyme
VKKPLKNQVQPGRIPYVGVGTAVAGALIGLLETALVLRFDVEVTVDPAGAVVLAVVNAGVIAALSLLFGFAIELFSRLFHRRLLNGPGSRSPAAILGRIMGFTTRVIPERRKRNRRTRAAATAVAFAVLLYGLYYANLYLPGKLHPISLLADVAILAAAYGILRLASFIALRTAYVWGTYALVFAAGVGLTVAYGAQSGAAREVTLHETEPLVTGGSRHNVLLITLDTTRVDRLGCYGGEKGLTPNVDALAEDGARYDRAYCTMPLTGPSHTAILSGLRPRETGVVQNGIPVPEELDTLAEIFSVSGYRTGAVVGAFPVCSKLGFNRGFDYFDDYFSPVNALTRLTFARILGDAGAIKTKARLQRRATEVTDRAIAWLDRGDGRPFFLWVHYFDPHTPYDPPDDYISASDSDVPEIRAYDGEVAYTDAEVGRLLDHVAESGFADDTVIIATADHGESLGEHDYYWDHGRYVYEPSMLVPLIMYGPGIEPGSTREGTVSNSLIFETALALATGEPAAEVEVGAIFGEALEDGVYRTMRVAPAGGSPYKFISNHGAETDEFYDLIADPGELDNLVGTETTRAIEFAGALSSIENKLPPLPDKYYISEETVSSLEDLGYISK